MKMRSAAKGFYLAVFTLCGLASGKKHGTTHLNAPSSEVCAVSDETLSPSTLTSC